MVQISNNMPFNGWVPVVTSLVALLHIRSTFCQHWCNLPQRQNVWKLHMQAKFLSSVSVSYGTSVCRNVRPPLSMKTTMHARVWSTPRCPLPAQDTLTSSGTSSVNELNRSSYGLDRFLHCWTPLIFSPINLGRFCFAGTVTPWWVDYGHSIPLAFNNSTNYLTPGIKTNGTPLSLPSSLPSPLTRLLPPQLELLLDGATQLNPSLATNCLNSTPS